MAKEAVDPFELRPRLPISPSPSSDEDKFSLRYRTESGTEIVRFAKRDFTGVWHA